MQIIRHARGARIVDGDDVVSEIHAQPGPTHTLFDVLAAGIAAFTAGPRVAVLGFAGGGIVAPLRGMHCNVALRCVDISLQGEAIFRDLSSSWAGDVRIDEDDASRWLRRQRTPFDCILEDLSLPANAEREGVKPESSLRELPELMARHLSGRGVVVVNMLPMPRSPWRDLLRPFQRCYRDVHVVHFASYVNRVLVAGPRLGTARETGRRLRLALHRIESAMAHDLRVRTLARPLGRR